MNYAVIIVTRNAINRIGKLLTAILQQVLPPEKIIVVDNASNDGTAEFCKNIDISNLIIIQNSENTGGAGGFFTGMRTFLSTGIQYAWIFDDDAVPLHPESSSKLFFFMERYSLKVAGSLIIDEENHSKTAFEYKTPNGCLVNVNDICKSEIIWDEVKFFNGVLIDREVISLCGFPRVELFIRGDEAEYRRRIRNFGYKMATTTEVFVQHPSSVKEYFNFLGAKVWYSDSRFKRYFTYRNRALLLSENGYYFKIAKKFSRTLLFNTFVAQDFNAIIDCCKGYFDGILKNTNGNNSKTYKELGQLQKTQAN